MANLHLTILLGHLIAALPMFMQPEPLPVKRLVANLSERIAKDPDNHELVYSLGRVHYLALVNQSVLVPAWNLGEHGPTPAPPHLTDGFVSSLRYDEATRRAREALGFDESTEMDREKWAALEAARRKAMEKLEAEDWRPEAPSMDQLHEHAEQAMVQFDKAIELAPEVPLYRLGRASLVEQCLRLELAGKLPKRAVIESLAEVDMRWVRDQYYSTFELALDPELETGSIPIEGMVGLVSHEAGRAFLRLTEENEKLGTGQKARIEKVREGMAALGDLKRGPITPILIGREGDTISDLLDPHAVVIFDLDGDGAREPWPWVCSDTAILAWDPTGRGSIDSGRQLFGSVTFFLFHRDGYRALSLLDDDGDGRLTGLELDGLVVWRDRDGDGSSAPDEVVPLWGEGIRELRTEATRGADGVPRHPSGARYGDGRVAPTFDWLVEPLPDTARPR